MRNRFLLEIEEECLASKADAIRQFKAKPIKRVQWETSEYLEITCNYSFLAIYRYADFLRDIAERDEIGCDAEYRYLMKEADADGTL